MKKKMKNRILKMWTVKDIPRDSRVLLRVDANVPLVKGRVSVHGQHRLKAMVPEIERLVARGARVILLAHLGEPKGKVVKELSLAPVARALSKVLERPVRCIGDRTFEEACAMIERMAPGAIVMFENLRFDDREEKNSSVFAKELATLGDVYVNNAFSVCHRKHASLVAITKYLPSFAGELVVKEMKMLSVVPKHPFVLILGGAKIATKIPLMKHLGRHADEMLLGGGTALTMLKANYGELPRDLPMFTQKKDVEEAKKIAKKFGKKIFLPCDLMIAKDAVPDIGPDTIDAFCRAIARAKYIVWNGSVGITEREDGFAGTLAIARAIAKNKKCMSIVGGGDTVDFLEEFDLTDSFTHVSTGGGAMLAYLGEEKMPGLEALR